MFLPLAGNFFIGQINLLFNKFLCLSNGKYIVDELRRRIIVEGTEIGEKVEK